MGPRGLGPWALWAPGALPKIKKVVKKGSGNYVVRKSWKTA